LTPVVRAEDDCSVVVLRGEADAASRPALSDVLSDVIAWRVGDVVIDLAEVAFIDTATIRSLAVARELLQRSGRVLTFRSPSRLAAQMIQLFGLTALIEAPDAVKA
jgi:anti-anti-sigma factor